MVDVAVAVVAWMRRYVVIVSTHLYWGHHYIEQSDDLMKEKKNYEASQLKPDVWSFHHDDAICDHG